MKCLLLVIILASGLAGCGKFSAELMNLPDIQQQQQLPDQPEKYFCNGQVFLESHNTMAMGWLPANDPQIIGYKVYQGNSSGQYTKATDTGTDPHFSIEFLRAVNYVLQIRGYTASGAETNQSREISCYDIFPTKVECVYDGANTKYYFSYLMPSNSTFSPVFRYNSTYDGNNFQDPGLWIDATTPDISHTDLGNGKTEKTVMLSLTGPMPAHLYVLRANLCM